MQLVSVQRPVPLVSFVELMPPIGKGAHKSRAQTVRRNAQADHNNDPGVKIDLDVGPRDQPKDEKSIHT
jgi:hypothetical protein